MKVLEILKESNDREERNKKILQAGNAIAETIIKAGKGVSSAKASKSIVEDNMREIFSWAHEVLQNKGWSLDLITDPEENFNDE